MLSFEIVDLWPHQALSGLVEALELLAFHQVPDLLLLEMSRLWDMSLSVPPTACLLRMKALALWTGGYRWRRRSSALLNFQLNLRQMRFLKVAGL